MGPCGATRGVSLLEEEPVSDEPTRVSLGEGDGFSVSEPRRCVVSTGASATVSGALRVPPEEGETPPFPPRPCFPVRQRLGSVPDANEAERPPCGECPTSVAPYPGTSDMGCPITWLWGTSCAGSGE